MRKLPPLTAIKTFEAAARHKNFKSAAAELHVTPAAVSLQIRQLEEWLGEPLFDRSGKTVELSAKGEAYLPEITQALNLLANATEQMLNDDAAGPLRITVLPSFAHQWLLPRLAHFKAAFPTIDLVVETSPDNRDSSSRQFDLAIRSGTGRWRGMHAELIAEETLTPMCSPALLAASGPIQSTADLLRFPLLHDTPRDGWARWLHAQGWEGVAPNRGYTFHDSAMVLQAAAAGLGIALGRVFLATDELAAGKLLTPCPATIKNDYSYWLLTPQDAAKSERVRLFRDWLMAEACVPLTVCLAQDGAPLIAQPRRQSGHRNA